MIILWGTGEQDLAKIMCSLQFLFGENPIFIYFFFYPRSTSLHMRLWLWWHPTYVGGLMPWCWAVWPLLINAGQSRIKSTSARHTLGNREAECLLLFWLEANICLSRKAIAVLIYDFAMSRRDAAGERGRAARCGSASGARWAQTLAAGGRGPGETQLHTLVVTV